MADNRGKSVEPDKLEVVTSFCYLRGMLSAAGGCKLSTTTRVKTVWKFKELLRSLFSPPLFSRHVAACTAVVFVLRFYGPVNPMGSCRARPVYLTTHLLGRLSPLSG